MPDARPLLVVDDDKNVRLTLSRALADLAPVDAAADGAEALRRIAEADYALVLLDLRLPEVGGAEVLGEVRLRRPDVPVVMMSAHATVETAVAVMRAGARDVLQKPFTADRVRTVVAEALLTASTSRSAETGRQRGESSGVDDYDARVARARAAVDGHLIGAAAEHARGALVLEPTRPEAFNVLGVVHQLRGDLGAAHQHFAAAAALRPGYAPALRNLENLAAAGGRRNVGRYDLGGSAGPVST